MNAPEKESFFFFFSFCFVLFFQSKYNIFLIPPQNTSNKYKTTTGFHGEIHVQLFFLTALLSG